VCVCARARVCDNLAENLDDPSSSFADDVVFSQPECLFVLTTSSSANQDAVTRCVTLCACDGLCVCDGVRAMVCV
jgi:hypothetical protein